MARKSIDDVITRAEASEILNMLEGYVDRLILSGVIPYKKISFKDKEVFICFRSDVKRLKKDKDKYNELMLGHHKYYVGYYERYEAVSAKVEDTYYSDRFKELVDEYREKLKKLEEKLSVNAL